jgi:hypothetical protein
VTNKIKNMIKDTKNNSKNIPAWQKDLVLNRIITTKLENFIPWEEAKKTLKVKSK